MEFDSLKLTCANAGHEFPVIRRGKGRFEIFKDKHDIPLGALEDTEYGEYVIQLNENDCIFVYSDGLPEATNSEGEQFGEERMLEVLNENPYGTPYFLIGQMEFAVSEFVGEADQFDDLTMLCVSGQKIESTTEDNTN